MSTKTWTKIGFCLLLFFIGCNLVYENSRDDGKLSAETNNTIQDGVKYKNWSVTVSNPNFFISPHQINFFGPNQTGKDTIIATLNWSSGIVTFEGNATGAARLMFQELGQKIADECKRKK